MNKKLNVFRLLLFVCVLGYAVWIFVAQQADINKNKTAISAVDNQIQNEEMRNEELKHEEEQVGTPEYMKKLAREKNGMIMPDEILYVDALKSNN